MLDKPIYNNLIVLPKRMEEVNIKLEHNHEVFKTVYTVLIKDFRIVSDFIFTYSIRLGNTYDFIVYRVCPASQQEKHTKKYM